jgi:carbon storage regulator
LPLDQLVGTVPSIGRGTLADHGCPHVRQQGESVMLVLSRKTSERILIGDEIAITIVRIGPNSVRVGIEAPKSMNIVREELRDFSQQRNKHEGKPAVTVN